jgi:hypothetical protein
VISTAASSVGNSRPVVDDRRLWVFFDGHPVAGVVIRSSRASVVGIPDQRSSMAPALSGEEPRCHDGTKHPRRPFPKTQKAAQRAAFRCLWS